MEHERDGAQACAAAIIPRSWVAGHDPEAERRLSDAIAERAERVEKAAAIIRAYRDREVGAALAEQAVEIERLRGALAHYAHIGTLSPGTTGTKAKRGRIGPDLGVVAREALAGRRAPDERIAALDDALGAASGRKEAGGV